MKNLLILTFFLILGNHCFSQGWNLNTTWVYESDEFGPPIDGNYLVLKVKRELLKLVLRRSNLTMEYSKFNQSARYLLQRRYTKKSKETIQLSDSLRSFVP